MIQRKAQTHNDGVVKIYLVEDAAAPGDMPNKKAVPKATLRYHERTVGIQRQQAALQDQVEISYLLRCPCVRSVSAQDIAIPNDGLQYQIHRVQYPEDVTPPVMYLELVRLEADYAIDR